MEIKRFVHLFVAALFVLAGWAVKPAAFAADADQNPGLTDRLKRTLSSDIYRFSFGGAQFTLENPEGFDVSSTTHENGRPEYSGVIGGGQFFWTFTGETANGWEGRRKRLWYAHFDSEKFDGLKLQNLMFGVGMAIDPSKPYAFGARLAGGIGTGFTRSSSYFDSALHVSAEAWISTGIQLGRITWDIGVRQRKTLGADLDERTAAPSTQIVTLSVGWLF